jgi:hypothetical protein
MLMDIDENCAFPKFITRGKMMEVEKKGDSK